MTSLGRRIHVDTKKGRRKCVSTGSFVRHGSARQDYLINRITNNLSVDKTDNQPFMQYLFQKRQLHRIEFSGGREKAHVNGCSFFSPCSANPKREP